MTGTIRFVLNGRIATVECGTGIPPTTTVLNYLRALPGHAGTKEGCAEGDCGACTVVLGEPSEEGVRYRAVDSCLLFLPMLHGKELITVEGVRGPDGSLHPVQQEMVEAYGSQCGFCTPGIVMSLYALQMTSISPGEPEIRRALAGNLCRCTGYAPIIEAAKRACAPGRRRGGGSHALLREIRPESLDITAGGAHYRRPSTLVEAVEYRRLHPDALVVNGATDIALRVTKNHEVLPSVLDLSGIDELRGWSEGEGITIGSGLPIEDLARLSREALPALAEALDVFASLQIRNLATVGGNLGTASPVGDLMPVLIAHEGVIVLRSSAGERRVPAAEFVTGYRRTALRRDELIAAVLIPPIPSAARLKSYKVSKRRDVDIAALSAGFRVELSKDGRVTKIILAYGGMADRVSRARRAEEHLMGGTWERPAVERAMQLIDTDFTPISDVRGSAAMRQIAARNLLLKFWADSTGNGGAA